MRVCRLAVLVLLISVAWGQDKSPGEALTEADRLADLRAWGRAEPHFIKAEKGFEQAGDARNALYAKLGRIRGELPRRSVAEVSQELADILELPLAVSDDKIRLRCLVIKGEVDEDYDAVLAEHDWREAVEVARRLNDPRWINRANAELGIVAALQGKTSEGLFLIASALKKAEETKDLSSVIRWLSILGIGFVQFGRPEEAIKYFDRALAAGSAIDELRFPLMAYAGKVSALSKLGRTEEARKLLNDTIAIARERESLGYQAELLREAGLLAEKAGHKNEAVALLVEALGFARKAAANRIIAEVYLDLGRIQLATGHRNDANKSFNAGVEAVRAIKDRLLTPRLLARFAGSEFAHGRRVEARALLNEASDITEGLLAGVWSPWVKARLIAVMDEVFLARVRTEIAMGVGVASLFPIVEQARGRAVTDLMMGRGEGVRAKSTQVRSGERRLTALQSQLWNARTSAIRQRLLDQIFRAEADMMPASIAADRLQQPRTSRTRIRAIEMQGALKPDEMLIEYILDDPRSFALVMTRDWSLVHALPARSQLHGAVDGVWKDIQAGKEAMIPVALAALVGVPGIASKKTLIVIPDGSLNRLPFELLPGTNGRMLLDTHAISYSPSATALALIRRQSSARPASAVLAVAASPEKLPAKVGGAQRTLRGMYDTYGENLPSLPAANAEAKLTVDTLPNSANRMLIGANATESALKGLPLADFAVAHFAAHGLLSSSFPERSALALRPSQEDDGFLQAREVLGLHLRAKLVTLSACNTGTGRLFGQDGVASLIRPFLASGARAVVANLWTADDTFSLALMQEFYQQLQKGQAKAVALQEAKRTMLRKYGKEAAPKLWSGFILFGEGAEPVVDFTRGGGH